MLAVGFTLKKREKYMQIYFQTRPALPFAPIPGNKYSGFFLFLFEMRLLVIDWFTA